MIYKIISQIDGTVFGRIDDDGLCRVTCVTKNPEFQEYLNNGGELQDQDGNVIDNPKEYVASLL
jgi:hypothetical protein